MLIKGMIVSLGGTPEPVIKTILEHKPNIVVFLTSQQSVGLLGKVQEELQKADFGRMEHKVIIVDDPNDLNNCFCKSLECAAFMEEKKIPRENVLVDYTGGTKNMTAALTLATARKGFTFSYVGGTTRTKNGLGIVETGSEVIHRGISPWTLHAVEQWQMLCLFVDHYHYQPAITLIRSTSPTRPDKERQLWSGLDSAVEGFLMWDSFNHREAIRALEIGTGKLSGWSEIVGLASIEAFVHQCLECFDILKKINSETKGFQKLAFIMVSDLLGNARRRRRQGRHDDAVARLYRALEMIAQLSLLESTGRKTSSFPPELVPQTLGADFIDRHKDSETGNLKLGLLVTFNVLKHLGHEAGMKFFDNEEIFRKILASRNTSILAHGTVPVSGDTFDSFYDLIKTTFEIEDTIEFPSLKAPI